MKITITVADVSIDIHGITEKAENDPAFWKFAATEWHKLYDLYVPMQTGRLKSSVLIRPKEIEYVVPYARRIYYGDGFHFWKDNGAPHPKASARWDQAAAPTQLPKLKVALQNYIDSGRLKLD